MFSSSSSQASKSGLRFAVLLLLMVEILFGAVASSFAGQARPMQTQSPQTHQASINLIEHPNTAAQMAVLCVGKAIHAELRQLCERMLAGYTGENLYMRDRLQNWHAVSSLPVLIFGEQDRLENLKTLNEEAFELEFMTLMLHSSQHAFSEAGKCEIMNGQPDPYVACRLAINDQQTEVAQIQTWLCAWYGDCRKR